MASTGTLISYSGRNGPRFTAVRIVCRSDGGTHSIHQVAPAWLSVRISPLLLLPVLPSPSLKPLLWLQENKAVSTLQCAIPPLVKVEAVVAQAKIG
jgi:hypothetical protein